MATRYWGYSSPFVIALVSAVFTLSSENASNFNNSETVLFKPFPNNKFLDSSKLKGSADDNFKFDENGRKFSKQVENTVGKGEIAHYEQFLLVPQCFQRTCTADT